MSTSHSRWTHPAVAAWRGGAEHANGAGLGHDLLGPEGTDRVDVESLERELERAVQGEVRFDAGTRAIYSHDSSNYRQAPIGVVIPRTVEDVVEAHRVCAEHDAPI